MVTRSGELESRDHQWSGILNDLKRDASQQQLKTRTKISASFEVLERKIEEHHKETADAITQLSTNLLQEISQLKK